MTSQQRSWFDELLGRGQPPPAVASAPGAEEPGIVAKGLAFVEEALDNGSALAQSKRGGRGDPPADELDEGEGKNDDGTVRRKPGRGGKFRGRDAKDAQDQAVDEAVRDFGLTEDERRKLHDTITGRGLGRDGVRSEAEAIRNGRKQPKAPDTPPDTAPDTAPNTAPDSDKQPADGEKSTPDSVIDGALIVAGVAIAVGVVAAPIPVVDVVVDTAALAVVVGAGLVIAGASLVKALSDDEEPPPEA